MDLLDQLYIEQATMGTLVPKPIQETELESSSTHEVRSKELLLDRIFEKVGDPSLELRNCRFVCKEWKRRATICLRELNWINRNFLVLNGVQDLMKYANTLAPSIPFDSEDRFIHYGRQAVESHPVRLDESRLFECYQINLQDQCHTKGGNDVKPYSEIPVLFFKLFPQSVRALNLTIPFALFNVLDNILATQSIPLSELRLQALLCEEDIRQLNDNEMSPPVADTGEEFRLVNLDYLCLEISRYPEPVTAFESAQEPVPTEFVEKVLKNLLSKISENKSVRICLRNWSALKETINLFQRYDQVNNLKVLDIDYPTEAEELKYLSEAGVQLQILIVMSRKAMKTSQRVPHPPSVYDLLESQFDCLEQFCWGSAWKFKFPDIPMAALKKLKLGCYKNVQDNESVDEIAWNNDPSNHPIFYNSFTKLNKVELVITFGLPADKFTKWLLPQQSPCTSVKEFEINYYFGLNAGILNSISSTFIHIKLLKIHGFSLESKIEEEIFFYTLWGAQFAPTLEEFSIMLPSLSGGNSRGCTCRSWRHKYELDKLFSGVDEDMIEEVTQSQSYFFSAPTHKSILNFKRLKALEIIKSSEYICRLPERPVFNDFSAYCAFGRLEKLGFLHLSKGMFKFSKDATYYLQEKLRSTVPKHHNYVSTAKRLEEYFCTNYEFLCSSRIRNFSQLFRSSDVTLSFRDLELDNENFKDCCL